MIWIISKFLLIAIIIWLMLNDKSRRKSWSAVIKSHSQKANSIEQQANSIRSHLDDSFDKLIKKIDQIAPQEMTESFHRRIPSEFSDISNIVSKPFEYYAKTDEPITLQSANYFAAYLSAPVFVSGELDAFSFSTTEMRNPRKERLSDFLEEFEALNRMVSFYGLEIQLRPKSQEMGKKGAYGSFSEDLLSQNPIFQQSPSSKKC